MNSQRTQLPHSLRPRATGKSHWLSMCILQIAREGPRNPRNCILVRGRALSGASFDILTLRYSEGEPAGVRTDARRKVEALRPDLQTPNMLIIGGTAKKVVASIANSNNMRSFAA